MRIVVTGMGAVSCLGVGVGAMQDAMLSGASGINPAGAERPDLPPGAVAGLVRSVPADAVPRLDAFLEMALEEALAQAGMDRWAEPLPVFAGTAHGHLDTWQNQRRGFPGHSHGLWDLAEEFLSSRGAGTDLTVVSTACTASSVALGLALDALRGGESGIALVAGAETLTPFLYAGFESLRSLAGGQCRPFDRDRSGLVLGEGAAALVLETEAHASKRGVTPLAEVAGFGFCADGSHLTAPDPAGGGAASALRTALAEARLEGPPDCVNAHGTGTRLNDRMECLALQRVFGEDAAKIPITSTKPMTGHLCGGAGAIEVVASILGLHTGTIPPILGFEAADPEFIHLDFVHGAPRHHRQRAVVTMNSGFGGTNTAIVLRGVEA